MNDIELARQIQKIFGPYLLGVCFVSQHVNSDGKPQAQCYFRSGFVMELGEKWYWITAGHIIKEIEKAQKIPGVKVSLFRFYEPFRSTDGFVPFTDFEDAWKYAEDDDINGIDFGAVEINSHDRRLVNTLRIIPVMASQVQPNTVFDNYAMVGFAEEDIERSAAVLTAPNTLSIQGKAKGSVNRVALYKKIPIKYQKPFPRLVGKLAGQWPGESMKGMSGGPIVGYSNTFSDITVIGLQASWDKASKTIFGSPLAFFLPRLTAAIRKRKRKR